MGSGDMQDPMYWSKTSDREQRLIDAILDIDAHAEALGEDDDGFVTGGYFISIGSLHRALGVVGHTAPKCRDCAGHDQHELRDANYGMWNAMQRAANHPERWQEFIRPALDRWRAVLSGSSLISAADRGMSSTGRDARHPRPGPVDPSGGGSPVPQPGAGPLPSP